MTNLWVTFSTDTSNTFDILSDNIIAELNMTYNFGGNVIDPTSDFIIYELSNNPIENDGSLQANNWKKVDRGLTILNPFQGYWLGSINTKIPTTQTSDEIININGYYHNTLSQYILSESTFYAELNNKVTTPHIFLILSTYELANINLLESREITIPSLSSNSVSLKKYIALPNNFDIDIFYYFFETDNFNNDLQTDQPTEMSINLLYNS